MHNRPLHPRSDSARLDSFRYKGLHISLRIPSLLTFLSILTKLSFSVSIPASSMIIPEESESVITFPPRALIFSTVNCATFPLPETMHFAPSKLIFLSRSIASERYTSPYPVASGRMYDPPYSIPFPVSTPLNWFLIFLYCPKR